MAGNPWEILRDAGDVQQAITLRADVHEGTKVQDRFHSALVLPEGVKNREVECNVNVI